MRSVGVGSDESSIELESACDTQEKKVAIADTHHKSDQKTSYKRHCLDFYIYPFPDPNTGDSLMKSFRGRSHTQHPLHKYHKKKYIYVYIQTA